MKLLMKSIRRLRPYASKKPDSFDLWSNLAAEFFRESAAVREQRFHPSDKAKMDAIISRRFKEQFRSCEKFVKTLQREQAVNESGLEDDVPSYFDAAIDIIRDKESITVRNKEAE